MRPLAQLAERIDALTLRERVMLFAALIAVLLLLLHMMWLSPLLARQGVLRAELQRQQGNMAGISGEIVQRVQRFGADPDAVARARLAALDQETRELAASVRRVQQGVVPPESMVPLLETLLGAHGNLQLVAMNTLPVSPMGAAAQAPSAAPAPAAAPLLFRHGVQLTVRGNYLDMVDYMEALQALPTHLFWGNASFDVDEYPNGRLTLTLYTLSLDKKWMTL